MKLADDLYPLLETIKWFSEVGSGTRPTFSFPIHWVNSRDDAIVGFTSDLWADAKTEAQGDLTGYLAKKRNDLYGSHWNNLVRQSRALLEKSAREAIGAALATAGFPNAWLDAVLVDVNRAVIEVAYRRQVPGAPAFFERLLRIYEAGRLPCGWTGDLDNWPAGEIILF